MEDFTYICTKIGAQGITSLGFKETIVSMKSKKLLTILMAFLMTMTLTPGMGYAQDSLQLETETAGEDTTFFYEGDEGEDSVIVAQSDYDDFNEDFDINLPFEWLDSWWGKLLGGGLGLMGAAIGIFVALFLLLFFTAPLWILALIIWLVIRNKRRNNAAPGPNPNAAAAMGATPTNTAKSHVASSDDIPLDKNQEMWISGIKECCLGVGLIILFVTIGWDGLWGIGALVLCMGISKLIISKTKEKQGGGVYASQPEPTANDTHADSPATEGTDTNPTPNPSENKKDWNDSNYSKKEN